MPSTKLAHLLQTPTSLAQTILKRRRKTTIQGRVVYDRTTHAFSKKDLLRIAKAVGLGQPDFAAFLEWLLKELLGIFIEFLAKRRKNVTAIDFITNRVFPGIVRAVMLDLSRASNRSVELLSASFQLAISTAASALGTNKEDIGK